MARDSYDTFISYSHADAKHAAHIDSFLRANGLTSFIDNRELEPGRLWVPGLERAMNSAKAVIVLLGARLGNTQQYERQFALVRQSRDPTFAVVPVLLPGVMADRPFDFLHLLTWVDFSKVAQVTDAPGELGRVVAAIRGDAESVVQEAICPYRGLDAFREEDAAFFFGRGGASDPGSVDWRIGPQGPRAPIRSRSRPFGQRKVVPGVCRIAARLAASARPVLDRPVSLARTFSSACLGGSLQSPRGRPRHRGVRGKNRQRSGETQDG